MTAPRRRRQRPAERTADATQSTSGPRRRRSQAVAAGSGKSIPGAVDRSGISIASPRLMAGQDAAAGAQRSSLPVLSFGKPGADAPVAASLLDADHDGELLRRIISIAFLLHEKLGDAAQAEVQRRLKLAGAARPETEEGQDRAFVAVATWWWVARIVRLLEEPAGTA